MMLLFSLIQLRNENNPPATGFAETLRQRVTAARLVVECNCAETYQSEQISSDESVLTCKLVPSALRLTSEL